MLEKQISYDSTVALSYNSDRENEDHWTKENEFIEKYFGKKCVGTILDIPIGTGRFLKFYPTESEVLGVDISSHMINEAQKEAKALQKTNVCFTIGDAGNLSSIAVNSIDTIVCCRLFHLVSTKDRVRFLQEFSRILKGELVLQLYIDKPPKKVFFRRLIKIIKNLWSLIRKPKTLATPWAHIKSYGLSELEISNIIQEASLEIVTKSTICSYLGSNVVMLILRNGKK